MPPSQEMLRYEDTDREAEQRNKVRYELGVVLNNFANGMDLMAKDEINAIKSDFSADELNNSAYNNKFTAAQEKLTAETEKILFSAKGTPEEKTKALELIFEKFQGEVRGIKGTKEAQDAQRSTKQEENMQKNEQKFEKFKENLFQKSREIAEKRLQEQKLTAQKLGDNEQGSSQQEAKESMRSTSAFGPPGNLEKGNSKK